MTALTYALVLFLGLTLLSATSEGNPLLEDVTGGSTTPCDPAKWRYPHPDYCTKYFECVGGTEEVHDCPSGKVFDDVNDFCVDQGSYFDDCSPKHPDRECKRDTAPHFIPHPTRCQVYYDCQDYKEFDRHASLWHRGYEKECKWPTVFDIVRKECFDYRWGFCGKPERVPAMSYCDTFSALTRGSHGPPCSYDFPTCEISKGHYKADGKYPAPNALWTASYFVCKDGRDIDGRQQCKEGEIFNPDTRECSAEDAESLKFVVTE